MDSPTAGIGFTFQTKKLCPYSIQSMVLLQKNKSTPETRGTLSPNWQNPLLVSLKQTDSCKSTAFLCSYHRSWSEDHFSNALKMLFAYSQQQKTWSLSDQQHTTNTQNNENTKYTYLPLLKMHLVLIHKIRKAAQHYIELIWLPLLSKAVL